MVFSFSLSCTAVLILNLFHVYDLLLGISGLEKKKSIPMFDSMHLSDFYKGKPDKYYQKISEFFGL